MPRWCRLCALLARASRVIICRVPVPILAHLVPLPAQLASNALGRGRRVGLPGVGRHVRGCRLRRGRLLSISVLKLVLRHALLRIDLGFLGAVGVDAALGEVVGAAARDDEGSPTVAIIPLAQNQTSIQWRIVAWQRRERSHGWRWIWKLELGRDVLY